MGTVTSTLMVVRCPYCVVGDEFRPMSPIHGVFSEYRDVRFRDSSLRYADDLVICCRAGAEQAQDRVVKTTVFLKNMSDFPAMNEVYGQFFKNEPPSRSTVQVAALPKDALIEIEAVALQ